MEDLDEYIDGLTKWAKEIKGITYIDVFELAEMMPEYDEYVKTELNKQ